MKEASSWRVSFAGFPTSLPVIFDRYYYLHHLCFKATWFFLSTSRLSFFSLENFHIHKTNREQNKKKNWKYLQFIINKRTKICWISSECKTWCLLLWRLQKIIRSGRSGEVTYTVYLGSQDIYAGGNLGKYQMISLAGIV